jgi:hypothetical protein
MIVVETKPLTSETCLGIATQIQTALARYDVPMNPSSDIAMFIREMRWLAEHLDKPKALLKATDQKRFVDGLLIVDQAENIAATFARLAETETVKPKLDLLKNRLNRLNKQGDPKARDIFFELEVAGRVAQYPQWHVSFREPDIIIGWPDGCIGLACKRVRSDKQLSKRIREAADQGARSGFPFFVILEVENLISAGRFLFMRSAHELESYANQRLSQLVLDCSRAAQRAFDKGAGGLILCGRFVGMIGSEPGTVEAIRWCLRHQSIPNHEFPGAGTCLDTLVDLMEARQRVS